MSILRFLFQTVCAFLQIKDRKHIEQIINLFRFGTWGAGWVKKLKHWDLRWRPVDCAF